MSEINWVNREQVIHEKVFDTLSLPMSVVASRTGSRAESRNSSSPFHMFSGRKVKWNHFGKKYNLRFSDYEVEFADLYDALMKKVRETRPDFQGELAFIDQTGRQVILYDDKDIREAMVQSKGKLKLHTTMARNDFHSIGGHNNGVISAAEMAENARTLHRPPRSQSVPPERGYSSYSHRSPSSMDSVPDNYRPRAFSPQPTSPTVAYPPTSPVQRGEIIRTTYSRQGSVAGYHPAMKYPYGPHYSQSLLYGMPPHNGMLWRFLANPFPFGGSRSYIGPNKYHFGGWGANHHVLHSPAFGPVW